MYYNSEITSIPYDKNYFFRYGTETSTYSKHLQRVVDVHYLINEQFLETLWHQSMHTF